MNKNKVIIMVGILVVIFVIAIIIGGPEAEINNITTENWGETIISPEVYDHTYQFDSNVKESPDIKSVEERVAETYGVLEDLDTFKYKTLSDFYGDPNFNRNRHFIGESMPKGLEIMNIDGNSIKIDDREKPIVLILTTKEHHYIKDPSNIKYFVDLVDLAQEFGQFDVAIVNMVDDGNAEFIDGVSIGYAPKLWTSNIKDFMEQFKEPVVLMVENGKIEFATALMSAQATSGVATAIFSSDIKVQDILSIMDNFQEEVRSYSPVGSSQERESIQKVSEAETALGYKINMPNINGYTTARMEIIGGSVFSVEYVGEKDTLTYRVSKKSEIHGDYRTVSWASDINDDVSNVTRRYSGYGANKEEIFRANYRTNGITYSLVSTGTMSIDFIKDFYKNIK